MRKGLPALAAALLAALLTACGEAAAPASATSATGGYTSDALGASATAPLPSQLRREGRFLIDAQNRVVLLHGVNAVWKLPPYAPPDTAEGFTAADADWLRAHGFNSVRLGVLFAGVMPSEGVIDSAYLDRIDRVVQLLTRRGIYVLFDFHQDIYSERYGGEGFPEWAVNSNGLPATNIGFPANYFTPAVLRTFDNFWAGTGGLHDRYREAWQAVAARWRAQDHHGGYDLFNEPFPGTPWLSCANPLGCPLFDGLRLQALFDGVRAGIRSVDRDNLVFYEPNFLFNSGALTGLGRFTPINEPQLGFSFHKYCLLGLLLHQYGATDLPTCPQFHQLVGQNAARAAQQMDAAALLTEFGASDDLADLQTVVDLADQEFTGWQYWHYKEWHDPTTESQTSGGQGLFVHDEDLGSVKAAKLAVLERPYPQATAGTPIELHFDAATAEFLYRYTPRAARADTEIHVPAVHYPNGYLLSLSGAKQVSAPGVSPLRLRTLPGAREVSVRLSRKP